MKKVLIIVGAILFTFIAALVVMVLLAIDKEDINNPNVVSDNKTTLEIVNNELYVDAKDINETEEVPILFSEEELEYLAYAILTSLNEEGSLEFTGVDFDVKNSEYKIKVQAKALGLVTTTVRVKLGFSMTNDAFVISFDNIGLGKLGLTWLAKILFGGMSATKIEAKLEKNGIYAKVLVKDKRIIISYEDLEKTLTANIDEENKDLISLLCDVFLKKDDLLKINFGDNDLLGAILYLRNAKYTESNSGELQYEYDITSITDKCKTLLETNVIDITLLDATFNFLVRGYISLSDEEKEVIEDIDYSSIGIISNKLYPGIIDRRDLSVSGYIGGLLEDKTASEILELFNGGIQISDDFLNGVFQSLGFVGFGYAFNSYDNDVGYFVIEQFIMTCYDERLVLDLVISINGCRIVLELDSDVKDTDEVGLLINCTVTKVCIGNVVLDEEDNKKLLAYLNNVMADLNWINTKPDEGIVTMDFSVAISDAMTSRPVAALVIGSILNNNTKVYVEEGYISIKK